MLRGHCWDGDEIGLALGLDDGEMDGLSLGTDVGLFEGLSLGGAVGMVTSEVPGVEVMSIDCGCSEYQILT